jgi:hypothetical protein
MIVDMDTLLRQKCRPSGSWRLTAMMHAVQLILCSQAHVRAHASQPPRQQACRLLLRLRHVHVPDPFDSNVQVLHRTRFRQAPAGGIRVDVAQVCRSRPAGVQARTPT